jgi:hypothetical protein
MHAAQCSGSSPEIDMHSVHKPPADRQQPTGAAPAANIAPFGDIPRWIWVFFLSAWALLFGLFVLFLATDAEAAFAVTIAVFFACMAFGLPAALAAQSPCEKYDCRGIVHTRTGPLPVTAAATQILTIPICAVIGLMVFITLAL